MPLQCVSHSKSHRKEVARAVRLPHSLVTKAVLHIAVGRLFYLTFMKNQPNQKETIHKIKKTLDIIGSTKGAVDKHTTNGLTHDVATLLSGIRRKEVEISDEALRQLQKEWPTVAQKFENAYRLCEKRKERLASLYDREWGAIDRAWPALPKGKNLGSGSLAYQILYTKISLSKTSPKVLAIRNQVHKQKQLVTIAERKISEIELAWLNKVKKKSSEKVKCCISMKSTKDHRGRAAFFINGIEIK